MPDKILKKDIVIPAGTVFKKAPKIMELVGNSHYEFTLGLTKDSSGTFLYYIEPEDESLKEWFEEI